MKSIMMASVALLSFAGAASVATAQNMPAGSMQPPGTEAPASPDNVSPPADQGMATNPSTEAMPAPGMNGQPQDGTMPADGSSTMPADGSSTMPAPGTTTPPMGATNSPSTMGGNMAPPPAAAQDYPVCSRTVTDSCINPGEAKRMGRRR